VVVIAAVIVGALLLVRKRGVDGGNNAGEAPVTFANPFYTAGDVGTGTPHANQAFSGTSAGYVDVDPNFGGGGGGGGGSEGTASGGYMTVAPNMQASSSSSSSATGGAPAENFGGFQDSDGDEDV
jgi:hypothetical protein